MGAKTLMCPYAWNIAKRAMIYGKSCRVFWRKEARRPKTGQSDPAGKGSSMRDEGIKAGR
jgi:hypothetical protein